MTDELNPAPAFSIIAPVYNEGAQLPAFLAAVRSAMDRLGEAWELILVDDGSSDETWAEVSKEAAADGRVRGLRLSRNFGKEAALCAGLEAARGAACITLDADLQHPPDLIPELVRVFRQTGANMVQGVKRPPRAGLTVERRVFFGLLKRCSGFDLKGASDFKLVDRTVRDAWLRMGERSVFYRGMIAWLGFHAEEVPFDVPARSAGRSKWSPLRLMGLATVALTGFSPAPLRLINLAGAAFLLLSLGLSIEALVLRFMGRAVSGFTTVIILLSVIGCLLMFSLGIMGEYLARIFDEVKGRPRYVVRERTGPKGNGSAAASS